MTVGARRMESTERLHQLFNEHARRFYTDQVWRRKFTRRLSVWKDYMPAVSFGL